MKPSRAREFPLLWKILLSTSIAITTLLALAGWFLHEETLSVLTQSLQDEVRGSFRAYDALWQSRADSLRTLSLVLSRMPDVRAAFRTNDRATIRDTAGEIWTKISGTHAMFLVTEPGGEEIASLSGDQPPIQSSVIVRSAAPYFPAQSAGFHVEHNSLYEFVVTPVYVESGAGLALIDVLAAGFPVNSAEAADLKQKTGSDFLFTAGGRVLASTLDGVVSRELVGLPDESGSFARIKTQAGEYAILRSQLRSLDRRPVGELLIVRSYGPILTRLNELQRSLVIVWLGAILAGLAGSYLLARKLLLPVKRLDEAAALIAKQKYDTRVPEAGYDELGRLAHTFNAMCESIQRAREDLIRQERLSTIGRISSSIVHDLRNPLAAIFGGAEMLMDGNLSEPQQRRIMANIYRSSHAIQDMLQELVGISRGSTQDAEPCRLEEVVSAAVEAQSGAAEHSRVAVNVDVPKDIELPMQRARMERVFLNLLNNAIEAMPDGGAVLIHAKRTQQEVIVSVEDTGPGIPPEIHGRLFEPFASSNKNGLGLGLALSRQTLYDHQGDLWSDQPASGRGARFVMRIPVAINGKLTVREQVPTQ